MYQLSLDRDAQLRRFVVWATNVNMLWEVCRWRGRQNPINVQQVYESLHRWEIVTWPHGQRQRPIPIVGRREYVPA